MTILQQFRSILAISRREAWQQLTMGSNYDWESWGRAPLKVIRSERPRPVGRTSFDLLSTMSVVHGVPKSLARRTRSESRVKQTSREGTSRQWHSITKPSDEKQGQPELLILRLVHDECWAPVSARISMQPHNNVLNKHKYVQSHGDVGKRCCRCSPIRQVGLTRPSLDVLCAVLQGLL